MEQGERSLRKQRLLKRLNKLAGDDSNGASLRHSASFHRNFRGYTELRIPKANGGFTIERCYTAPWYYHDLTDRQWLGLKLGYALLYLISAALFLLALALPAVTNVTLLTGIPATCSVIGLVICLAVIGEMLITKRRMTISACEAGDRPLRRCTGVTALCIGLTALAKLLSVFIYLRGHFLAEELPGIILMLFSAAALFAVFRIQKRITYRSEENTAKDDPKFQNTEKYDIT